MKREEIIAALAAMGKEASESSVAQALRWWCDADHVKRVEHGVYDLMNREALAEPAGAGA